MYVLLSRLLVVPEMMMVLMENSSQKHVLSGEEMRMKNHSHPSYLDDG